MMKKFPPIQKILEAYTALADQHVKLEANQALVTSSNNDKTYTVSFHDDIYSSNDNATYWQGYAGYPIIAVLMLQGKLPYDEALAKQFADINWNKLNTEYKRNYEKAAQAIMAVREIDESAVDQEIQAVYEDLKKLPITIKRGSLRPPKK